MRFAPENVWHVEQTGSTNDCLREKLQAGLRGWLAFSADTQTAGRGRHARCWLSPAGGLYLSVSRPLPTDSAPVFIPVSTSVAVAEYLAEAYGVRAALKWPNDLVASDRKLAGVLSELVALPDRDAAVIVGVGLNVNTPVSLNDGNLAVALGELTGYPVDVASLRGELLAAIARCWQDLDRDGSSAMVARWRARCEIIGTEVEITTASGPLRGRCLDVTDSFALRLETAQGLREVVEGDVRRLRSGAPDSLS